MPLIETSFQRVAVDLVQPMSPVTDCGKGCILCLADYATRYPKTAALRGIEEERVADGSRYAVYVGAYKGNISFVVR